MQINTHFFNTVNLQEVRDLLPSNHCIRKLDDTVVPGLQEAGDYFVTTVGFFFGKKKRGNTCMARVILYEVLEDDTTEDKSLECFMYGPFCEALEENLRAELETRGTWSGEKARHDGKVVWVVLHRPFIQLYRGAWKGWHPLSIVVGPDTSPHCRMWLLLGMSPMEGIPSPYSVSEASIPSPSLIDPASPAPLLSPPSSSSSPLPLTSTTPTTITLDAQPSTSRIPSSSTLSKKFSSATQASLACSRPTSSTHPSPPDQHSPVYATSTTSPALTRAVPPASAKPSSSAQSHALPQSTTSRKSTATPTVQSPSQAQRQVQDKSPSKGKRPSETKPSSSKKSPARAKLSVTARSPGRPCDLGRSRGSKIRIEYRLKPLSEAEVDCKMSSAGVVVEVVKAGYITKNGTTYDIIKVADKGLTEPSSTQTHIMIKVFHNDKVNWPEDGKPERGQVMVLKDMMCKQHKGNMEGIVYTTKMVCVCKCDENNHLTWYSHSQKCPHNIERAEDVAQELFDWWAKEGSAFQFRQLDVQLAPRSAAVLPTCDISRAGGKGLFTLFCQVVKKTLYPAPVNPKCVLRVCDGTRSSYQFEEITYDPSNEVDDSQRVFGIAGSLEVDILVSSNTIPSEIENLQVGSFVRLRGVDCIPLPSGCRKLIFIVAEDDEYLKVLGDDDPELVTLKSEVLQARAEEELEDAAAEMYDDGCSVDSEEMDGGAGLIVRESPAPPHVSPSPMPDLPSDSFEVFVRQKGNISRAPPGGDSPTSKRRRLNFHISGHPSHPSPQSSTTKHPSHPFPQPHTSKHVQSLQSSTSRQHCPSSPQTNILRQTVHSFSPQLSNLRQSLHPSSPHPSTSKQSLHPSSPKPATPRQQQDPTHGQSCSPISTHYGALEELQQLRTADYRYSVCADISQADSCQTHPNRHLKFHTEVVGEMKKTSLETFFFKGKVGEMHQVEVVIRDFRVITTKECPWCRGADHLCLHQWVWGLCQRCDSAFSSSQLYNLFSTLALNSLNFLQCKNCFHQYRIHNSGETNAGESPARSSGSSVSPFIKVKVVVEDPTSGFQLTPWLTADNASFFFGTTPNFRWIIKMEEAIQEVVEALLKQNCSLTLGMMKQEVEGKVDLRIVNTCLHSTQSRSKTIPPKPTSCQPFPASPSHPQISPTSSPHPQISPSSSPHPQISPTGSPHPQISPTSSPHPDPLPPTSPHLQLNPVSSPQTRPPPASSPHSDPSPQARSPASSPHPNPPTSSPQPHPVSSPQPEPSPASSPHPQPQPPASSPHQQSSAKSPHPQLPANSPHPHRPPASPSHPEPHPTSPPNPHQHHTAYPETSSSVSQKSRFSLHSQAKAQSSSRTHTCSEQVQKSPPSQSTPTGSGSQTCSTPSQQTSQCYTTPPQTQSESPQSQSFITPPQAESPHTD